MTEQYNPPRSMAHSVWRDLTPLGRWTIGIPLVFMVYATMAVLTPFAVLVLILVKTGIVPLLDKPIVGVKSLFFENTK